MEGGRGNGGEEGAEGTRLEAVALKEPRAQSLEDGIARLEVGKGEVIREEGGGLTVGRGRGGAEHDTAKGVSARKLEGEDGESGNVEAGPKRAELG